MFLSQEDYQELTENIVKLFREIYQRECAEKEKLKEKLENEQQRRLEKMFKPNQRKLEKNVYEKIEELKKKQELLLRDGTIVATGDN